MEDELPQLGYPACTIHPTSYHPLPQWQTDETQLLMRNAPTANPVANIRLKEMSAENALARAPWQLISRDGLHQTNTLPLRATYFSHPLATDNPGYIPTRETCMMNFRPT